MTQSGLQGSYQSSLGADGARWARSCSLPQAAQPSFAFLMQHLPLIVYIFTLFIVYIFTLFIFYIFLPFIFMNILSCRVLAFFSFLSRECHILFPSLNSKTEKHFRYKIQMTLLNETKKLQYFIANVCSS